MADVDGMRRLRALLVSGREHYERVVCAATQARHSLWIATANLKELMVQGPGGHRARYRSVLEVFDGLAERGVQLRILHSKLPSRPFRDAFDRFPRLYRGGLELRLCARVHMKAVVIDAEQVYLGSANWTGAGLGAKGEDRRNFELGFLTDDGPVIDAVQDLFDRIWRGEACAGCRLREACEAPLDLQGAA